MFEVKLVEELARVNRHLDAENLSEILMKAVARIMEAERAIVILTEGRRLSDGHRDLGVQYSSHPLDQMAVSRTVIEDSMDSPNRFALKSDSVNPTKSMGLHKIRSCISAVVKNGDAIIGALYCDIRKSKKDFIEEDARRLLLVAEMVTSIVLRLKEAEFIPLSVTAGKFGSHSLDLVGCSTSITSLKEDIKRTAHLSHSVLITAPTGCGKEVVARLLHSESRRRGRFVALNCAESSESVLASELFGHEKGAFTDANVSRTGLIVAADGGTLFLDEIGNASTDFQAKLLRVLETREVRPIGSDNPSAKVNVRFIFATNKDLERMVTEKEFMNDLYYRMNQIRLTILPLGKRKEDIRPLAIHCAKPKHISEEAITHLTDLEWPGNVRELKQVVELSRDLASDQEITYSDVLSALRYSSKLDKVHSTLRAIDVGEMNFYQMKACLEEGKLSYLDLDRVLQQLYAIEGQNWANVGRKLGMISREDLKKFDNFVQNARKRLNLLKGAAEDQKNI